MDYGRTQDIIDRITLKQFDGNSYKATIAISNKALELLEKVENSVSSGEAIDWALTGVEPDNLEQKIEQHRNSQKHRTPYLEKIMSYIDDKEIENAVRDSFDQSVKIGSLTFYYDRMADKYKKKRVRVLTRMCWYNFHN